MVRLTETAIKEIQRLQVQQNKQTSYVRLATQPGGCKALVYTMGFVDQPESSDHLHHCDSIQVAVSESSAPHLADLELDYAEDLMGGAFCFNNPQATDTCGCGNSFSVEPA